MIEDLTEEKLSSGRGGVAGKRLGQEFRELWEQWLGTLKEDLAGQDLWRDLLVLIEERGVSTTLTMNLQRKEGVVRRCLPGWKCFSGFLRLPGRFSSNMLGTPTTDPSTSLSRRMTNAPSTATPSLNPQMPFGPRQAIPQVSTLGSSPGRFDIEEPTPWWELPPAKPPFTLSDTRASSESTTSLGDGTWAGSNLTMTAKTLLESHILSQECKICQQFRRSFTWFLTWMQGLLGSWLMGSIWEWLIKG